MVRNLQWPPWRRLAVTQTLLLARLLRSSAPAIQRCFNDRYHNRINDNHNDHALYRNMMSVTLAGAVCLLPLGIVFSLYVHCKHNLLTAFRHCTLSQRVNPIVSVAPPSFKLCAPCISLRPRRNPHTLTCLSSVLDLDFMFNRDVWKYNWYIVVELEVKVKHSIPNTLMSTSVDSSHKTWK